VRCVVYLGNGNKTGNDPKQEYDSEQNMTANITLTGKDIG